MIRWTPDKDAVLRAHWGKGKTAAQIGDMIGRNKNQVIGRAHRLGLKLPKTEQRGPKKFVKARAPMVRRVLRDGVSGCQWIDGEPRERKFCGAKRRPDSSYCDEHHKQCWIDPRNYQSEAA